MFFEDLYLRLHQKDFEQEMAAFGNSPKSVVITIGKLSFRITLDWEMINELVKTKIVRPDQRLYGGMIKNLRMTSFSDCSDESDLIVINPGNLFMLWHLSWFRNPERQLHRRISGVLAHELGHLFQQHRGYGWVSCLIQPVLQYFALIVVTSVLLITMNLISWWLFGLILGYIGICSKIYQWHPLEIDANEFSRDNWREWAKFVHVERLEI